MLERENTREASGEFRFFFTKEKASDPVSHTYIYKRGSKIKRDIIDGAHRRRRKENKSERRDKDRSHPRARELVIGELGASGLRNREVEFAP